MGVGKCLRKYTLRVYRFYSTLFPEQHGQNELMQKYHQLGNKFSWVIPLDTTGLTVYNSTLLTSFTELRSLSRNTQSVTTDSINSTSYPCTYYSLDFSLLYSNVLRYEYIIWRDALQRELLDRLSILQQIERMKHKVPDDINDWDYLLWTTMHKPEGWSHWDNQMSVWMNAVMGGHKLKEGQVGSSAESMFNDEGPDRGSSSS